LEDKDELLDDNTAVSVVRITTDVWKNAEAMKRTSLWRFPAQVTVDEIERLHV